MGSDKLLKDFTLYIDDEDQNLWTGDEDQNVWKNK